MVTKVRPVRFHANLLEELERRLAVAGEDLSHFVNVAVDRELHGDERHLRAVPDPIDAGALEDCAVAFRRALLARDARQARVLVEDLLHRGAAVIDVYEAVLAEALREIGELWCLDEISVAQEHFATAVTADLMATLAPDRRLAPTSGRLAIVGGSPDELHALGARMVGDVLERAGWEVLALGAATPADALVELVDEERPDLVALSTATVGRLPGVEQVLGQLAGLDPRPVIAVGGALYTGPVVELVRGWGADVIATDLRALLPELHRRFPPPG
jgi:methanogenic corrinoid protein MtbC1